MRPANQYLNFKETPNFMKIGSQLIFMGRITMEPLIFNESIFEPPKAIFIFLG